MKWFAMTPLPLLFLLLKLPRSPPSFQETALGAVASQVQHLGKQNHEFWQSSRGKFFCLTNTTMKQLFLQCSRKISYNYEEENRKPPGCAWSWARCRWECGAGFSAGEGQPWELSSVYPTKKISQLHNKIWVEPWGSAQHRTQTYINNSLSLKQDGHLRSK